MSFSLDSQYTSTKESKSDDTPDLPLRINQQQSNNFYQSLTTASSRKSSFSEFGTGK